MEAIWTRDIRLARLRRHDCEMLRQWRNAEHIRKNMFYQEFISQENQVKWFNGLRPDKEFYYLIRTDKPIGLINIKEIEDGQGDVGLFIHDTEYWGSPYPLWASWLLLTAFFSRKDIRSLRASVHLDNNNAVEYNRFLGFEWMNSNQMLLKKEDYFAKGKHSSVFKTLEKSNPLISVLLDPNDYGKYDLKALQSSQLVIHRLT